MQVSEATALWLEYHKSHSKENSVRAYKLILSRFCEDFGSTDVKEITTERILVFLNRITEGKKRQTKRTRYSHLLASFNFIKNNLDQEFRNPCDTPMLKKLFRARPTYHWNIIEKETVDEVIIKTPKPRNRLILELMARSILRHLPFISNSYLVRPQFPIPHFSFFLNPFARPEVDLFYIESRYNA